MSMADNRVFTASDGFGLSYKIWIPDDVSNMRGFVQILHGVSENCELYNSFAEYLNNCGFGVFAHNCRDFAQSSNKVVFWNRICSDACELAEFLSSEYPDKVVFLLGFGMGSLIARTIVPDHAGMYGGLIILGTSGPKGVIGKLIYNIKIKKQKLCPGLTVGISVANSKKRTKRVPHDMPVFLMSGENDPAGSYGRGTADVYRLYRNAGISDLKYKLIHNSGYELLHEPNKDEIYTYITNWLADHI